MTVIATDSNRLSTVVKFEYKPNLGICREAVTVNDTAQTYNVGQVLGATLVGGAASGIATAGNTGNATMGAVTVNPIASVGIHRVVFTAATTFYVLGVDGRFLGNGTTGTAFSAPALSFTITAGGTPMAAGDSFTIPVTGTVKYKVAKANATDGSAKAAAIYIADGMGIGQPLVLTNATDTSALVLVRGPAIVAKSALILDASYSTAAQIAQVYADLKLAGIAAETTI